jgi:cell division septation protein DedD
MKTKDFREIQVSSTLLVVIFLCVLVLGVFIFLLGVSVGKKQNQIAAATQVVAQQVQNTTKDQLAQKTAEPAQKQVKSGTETGLPANPAPPGIQEKPAAKETSTKASPEIQPAVKEPQKTAPKTAVKSAATSGTGLFFIQVAAFTDRAQAAAEADKFKKRGYPAVVADPRPTDIKSWYRVRVGSYSTREKAAEVLTKLNEAAKKRTDYRIVKD